MKRKVRAPYFETGTKCYIYGDQVFELAKAAEAASVKYDVDVLFIAPYVDIRRIREACPHLVILAPYMDTLQPGRGMGSVLPEALKEAGADGVVINHCEHPSINNRQRPIELEEIRRTIERANECDLLSFVCANTIEDAGKIAAMNPDILNPEPTELIGTTTAPDMNYVKGVIDAVKQAAPDVLVELAAGITKSEQIYDFIMAGSAAAGAASGLFRNPDEPETPFAHPIINVPLMEEMISYVAKAKVDLAAQKEA